MRKGEICKLRRKVALCKITIQLAIILVSLYVVPLYQRLDPPLDKSRRWIEPLRKLFVHLSKKPSANLVPESSVSPGPSVVDIALQQTALPKAVYIRQYLCDEIVVIHHPSRFHNTDQSSFHLRFTVLLDLLTRLGVLRFAFLGRVY